MVHERYVVLDIETYVVGDKPDPEKDILRYIGFKNDEGRKVVYHADEKDNIQKVLTFYKYFVGHNIQLYDIPILERHGFTVKGTIIDTYTIADKRCKQMMYIDLNTGDRSLRALCNRFDLQHKKGEFDYSLLKKERLYDEEYDSLVEYLHGDLDSSDDLFRFFYEFFYGFREFMSEKNKNNLAWLRCSSGSTAYKAICNIASLPEEYTDQEDKTDEVLYGGGYVSEPYLDFVEGNIYCCDFASLYPHMMMRFCLYNQAKKGQPYFTGSEIYPTVYGNDTDGIAGKYARQMGKVENAIQTLYNKRMEVTNQLETEEDPTEKKRLKNLRLTIKILINSCYGVIGSPTFKSVHDITAASDCTALARRTIKHARTTFERAGYECLYTDTDSVFVLDKKNNENSLKSIVEYISTWQRSCMNVPITSHKLVMEAKIKRIHFFRDDKGEFIKKHYIYVTDKDEIKVKGMQVVRGNCSKLASLFFEEVIKKQILENKYTPYRAHDLLYKIKQFSIGKEELLLKRYRAKPPESYKVKEGADEATGLYYQIAKKYGVGEHWLVINKRIGAGKGNRYAKMEELKEKYGDSWIDQVCFEMYLNDLKEFIIVEDRNKLHKVDRTRIKKE